MEERIYTFGHETCVEQYTIAKNVKAEGFWNLKYD